MEIIVEVRSKGLSWRPERCWKGCFFFLPYLFSLLFSLFVGSSEKDQLIYILGRHASVIMTVQLIARMTFLDFWAKANTQSAGAGLPRLLAAGWYELHTMSLGSCSICSICRQMSCDFSPNSYRYRRYCYNPYPYRCVKYQYRRVWIGKSTLFLCRYTYGVPILTNWLPCEV